jgi:hypothetical protein
MGMAMAMHMHPQLLGLMLMSLGSDVLICSYKIVLICSMPCCKPTCLPHAVGEQGQLMAAAETAEL